MFFKYLYVTADRDEKVLSLAQQCLLEHLLKRPEERGDLFFKNFVAVVFYANSYPFNNNYEKTER